MNRTVAFMLAAIALGCGGEKRCAEKTYQCVENTLQICKSGEWVDEEDCAADGMICHAMGSMSHCMEEGAM